MQKKLIALAVAGLASTAAFAQSNVTIYGVVDQVIQHSKTDTNTAGVGSTAKRNGLDAGYLSGSRLGFKGEEDLGNGLKAVFLLENGLQVDTAGVAGTFSALSRQAYVGLQGGFGRVSFGRQYAPGYFAPGSHDGFESATISPQSILSVVSGMTITPNSGARINNAVNYVSNTMSGFSANAIYGFGEPTTGTDPSQNKKNGNFIGIGGNYANGPITANVTYHQSYESLAAATPAASPRKNKEWYIGGSYDLGVVKLGASYQQQKGDNNAAGTGDGKDKLYQVSAVAPVGKGAVRFGYGRLKENGTTANVADAQDKAKSYTLAYTHPLSKRTTAYAGYNQTKYDDGAAGGGTDTKTKTYGAGLRHVF